MTTREVQFHGNTVMAHIAMAEQLNGKTVDWKEQESSQQDRT